MDKTNSYGIQHVVVWADLLINSYYTKGRWGGEGGEVLISMLELERKTG